MMNLDGLDELRGAEEKGANNAWIVYRAPDELSLAVIVEYSIIDGPLVYSLHVYYSANSTVGRVVDMKGAQWMCIRDKIGENLADVMAHFSRVFVTQWQGATIETNS